MAAKLQKAELSAHASRNKLRGVAGEPGRALQPPLPRKIASRSDAHRIADNLPNEADTSLPLLQRNSQSHAGLIDKRIQLPSGSGYRQS